MNNLRHVCGLLSVWDREVNSIICVCCSPLCEFHISHCRRYLVNDVVKRPDSDLCARSRASQECHQRAKIVPPHSSLRDHYYSISPYLRRIIICFSCFTSDDSSSLVEWEWSRDSLINLIICPKKKKLGKNSRHSRPDIVVRDGECAKAFVDRAHNFSSSVRRVFSLLRVLFRVIICVSKIDMKFEFERL